MRNNIDGHYLLIGLMAYPIRHSLSPQMQNTIYSKLNIYLFKQDMSMYRNTLTH